MAKFCPNCGQMLEDSASFCPNCGARIDAPPQTPASKSHADRSDRFDLGTPPPIGMSSGAPAPAAPETASPTLPIDEIDWDNDFYF